MAETASNQAVASAPSIRMAALSLVPFAAIVVAMAAAALYALTVPSSSPPSVDDVTLAVILLWVLSLGFLVVSAAWAPTHPTRHRRATASGIALLLVAAGWWVSSVLNLAWVDACEFGAGSGDRCNAGTGSAPGWARMVWPVFGLLIGALCAGVAVTARHSDGA